RILKSSDGVEKEHQKRSPKLRDRERGQRTTQKKSEFMADAAPTGCYKCGRPGHWSRDCPDSNPDPNSNPNPSDSASNPKNSFTRSFPSKSGNTGGRPPLAPKPKKVPRTRPKLTPELLLSDDGLGFVLRYFPKNFKFRGRGHEASDLGHLIGLYSEWHKHLLPYYSFDQFIQRVERVAATRRVKMCISALRDKVAQGGDPTKLNESPAEDDNLDEQDPSIPTEAMDSEDLHWEAGPSSDNHDDPAPFEEDLLREIYDNVTQEPPKTTESEPQQPDQTNRTSTSCNGGVTEITEEQKARIEANRLKALEKAAARKLLQQQQSASAQNL
ncbi:TIMELESS-interacting protein, partial [Linum grandiflorum]